MDTLLNSWKVRERGNLKFEIMIKFCGISEDRELDKKGHKPFPRHYLTLHTQY